MSLRQMEEEGFRSMAVAGGYDIDGERMYVGRTFHDRMILPGKLFMDKDDKRMYVAYDGKETRHNDFEVSGFWSTR